MSRKLSGRWIREVCLILRADLSTSLPIALGLLWSSKNLRVFTHLRRLREARIKHCFWRQFKRIPFGCVHVYVIRRQTLTFIQTTIQFTSRSLSVPRRSLCHSLWYCFFFFFHRWRRPFLRVSYCCMHTTFATSAYSRARKSVVTNSCWLSAVSFLVLPASNAA